MNIAVVGLWHLGTVTAACLASAGHAVVGYDDVTPIERLQNGYFPVAEPGLEDLTRKELTAGRLRFTSDPRDLGNAEIVWFTYDTPVDDEDRADVAAVLKNIKELFPHLPVDCVILISSQLPVGSTRHLEEEYDRLVSAGRATFSYVAENLRLGNAIVNFTRPERTVVGVRSQHDRELIAALLSRFTEKIEWMSVESAEMAKHALNAFLATSVVFVNEIATLCERVGANARDVERALRSDPRVGPRAYLRPGGAFAGGTLARDVTFLTDIAHREGLPTPLLAAVLTSNENHGQWSQRRLVDIFGNVAGVSVAVLGMTYKPGTDTLRRSSAIETCRWLRANGASVAVYDPVVKELPADLSGIVDMRETIEAALCGSVVALVATEWPEFRAIRPDDVVRWMTRPVVLDPGRFLDATLGADSRIRYISVGSST